jgi:hypothetical protein
MFILDFFGATILMESISQKMITHPTDLENEKV